MTTVTIGTADSDPGIQFLSGNLRDTLNAVWVDATTTGVNQWTFDLAPGDYAFSPDSQGPSGSTVKVTIKSASGSISAINGTPFTLPGDPSGTGRIAPPVRFTFSNP
jgi:hypothetical protein